MDFVGNRRWFFIISALIIVAGLVSILIPPSFRIGIEFTGGSALSLSFSDRIDHEEVRLVLQGFGHDQALVQGLSGNAVLIRTRTLEGAQTDNATSNSSQSERQRIEKALEERFSPITTSELFAVSPIIAKETIRNAGIAVAIAALAILLYITWAFRLVPNSFRMGGAAIIAATHDVLVVLALFSILGKFFNIEINAMFITGILTVVGYSVHDTIVVFDRIRENTERKASRDLGTTINISIMQTLGRSLTTSLTTMAVLLALLLLGGTTIQSLLFTLLIGVITGTYSSICIASQVLIVWERREWLGPLRRRSPESSQPTSN